MGHSHQEFVRAHDGVVGGKVTDGVVGRRCASSCQCIGVGSRQGIGSAGIAIGAAAAAGHAQCATQYSTGFAVHKAAVTHAGVVRGIAYRYKTRIVVGADGQRRLIDVGAQCRAAHRIVRGQARSIGQRIAGVHRYCRTGIGTGKGGNAGDCDRLTTYKTRQCSWRVAEHIGGAVVGLVCNGAGDG